MNTGKDQQEQLLKAFQQALNQEGYSFQHAVVWRAKQLFNSEKSEWSQPVVEFPVETQGQGTRVDVIWKHHHKNVFIVAECKRINPAFANWCFVRAPGTTSPRMVVESIDSLTLVNPLAYTEGDLPYQIGIEAKSTQKGDSIGGKSDLIEAAATQVCRGLNGYVNTLLQYPELQDGGRRIVLLPVIFTTANIYVSDADLRQTNITDGFMDLSNTNLTKKPWIVYEYHMSPGLKHLHMSLTKDERKTLQGILTAAYVRSIPIVSADGIAEFLAWAGEYPW